MPPLLPGADSIVPVFPLPNAVLFPDTVLPLLVFEPRYRRLVEDVSAGDGRFVIALLRPGFEADYEGSPAFFRTGTVGHIDRLERLSDGRFTLNLVGQERVELREVPSSRPYRLVRITPRPEPGVDDSDLAVRQAKLDLLASHSYLLREISGDGAANLALNTELPFSAAVNGSCANLPIGPETRQKLLELDDLRLRQRQAQGVINQVLQKVLELKSATATDHGGRELN